MANEEDVGESWQPPEEEAPVTEQEKLKLELQKLNEQANVSLAPKGVDPKKIETLKETIKGTPESAQTPLKEIEKAAEEPPPAEPVDIGKLSTAPIRAEGVQPEASPAKDISVTPRSDFLKTMRGPLAQEIENNPHLKLRVAALLDLENPGAGPAVVESLLNRGVYSNRSVDSITSLGPRSFYGPGRKPGMVEGRMAEIASNPQKLNKLFRLIEAAYTSNVVEGHTDQGSKGDPNYDAGGVGKNINGERFNDWGGGPGGIAGARAFRAAIQAKAGMPDVSIDEIRPFMNPTLTALQKPELEGGLADTPQKAAQMATLMTGTPIEKIKNIAAVMHAASKRGLIADDASTASPGRRVSSSRVSHTDAPRGIIPGAEGSVPQTTYPVPGMETSDYSMATQAANPSMMSTIMNYQAEQAANAPPPPPQAELRAGPPTFMEKVMNTIKGFAPQGAEAGDAQRREVIKQLLDKPVEQETSAADWLRKISQFDQDITKGGVSGIAALPGQIWSSGVGPVATIAGQLSGSPGLTKFGVETQMDSEEGAKRWQQTYGVDPNNPTQMGANTVFSNIGGSPAATLRNLIMSKAAEKVVAPAAEYLGKNYPIPNINPISPAQAATVFGKPPLVVNTPAGPLVMNDADISQFAYGGALAVGFGSSPALIAKGVRGFRNFKPLGLDGVFDPRRGIPGAPGTEAASIPTDIYKGGVIDQGKMMIDVAERQAKYEKATKVGIDPIAANEVLQAWRVQTNSGAQNLISSALTEGEMNVPDYRFKVQHSIKALVDYSTENPQFPEYIRLRTIQDELRHNTLQNQGLPPASKARLPDHYLDPNNTSVKYDTNNVATALSNAETNYPEFRKMYTHYQDNLDATRDLVTSHPTNSYENHADLTAKAVERPSLPIFSTKASANKLFTQVLRGDNPLAVAETNMRKAFEKQLKTDAELRYIKMAQDSVGSKSFTERKPEWATGTAGSVAEKAGAILHRRVGGEDKYWTADPLLVSVMNSGHVPLSAMETHFASVKGFFQKTTTGAFAPWFAPTGMLRAMEQGWATAPGALWGKNAIRDAKGRIVLPAGPWSTTMGMLTRMGAEMARPTATFFRGVLGNNALGRMLNPQQSDLIARSFEKWYMDSYYKRLKVSGAFSGDQVMEGKEVYTSIAKARQVHGNNPVMNPVLDFMEKATGHTKAFTWDVLKKGLYKPSNAALTAVQESPAYGFTRKVLRGSDETHRPTFQGRELSDAEVAEMAFKNYTGNPSTRGYIYQKNGQPLRFEKGEGLPNRPLNAVQKFAQHGLRATWGAQADIATTVGKTAHYGRSVTPWAGVLFQSPAATLAAMRDNPVRANLFFSASHVLPEVTAYLWNSYHSQQLYDAVDENGDKIIGSDGKPVKVKYDYVNHMINGRNDHNLLNNTYFAVPGKRPNDGVEFRHYQEGVMNRYMARMFMHQYFGKAYGTMGDDVLNALGGFMDAAIIPPMPSPVGAYLASKGMVATSGWMGNVFKARNNPYIDLGGGESKTELLVRAILPSIADIGIQAMQAGMHSPDWASVPGNVASQVGKRMAGRTALVGDALGIKPDVSGSTTLSGELWENKKFIDDLLYRYRVMDVGQGAVKTNKGSKSGRAYVEDYMGELPPLDGKDIISNPGLQQKDPTNPLYKMLMNEMEETFAKDEPKKGGIGYKSMWGQYGVFGQLANRMRTVDDGNAGQWVEEQLDKSELMQWLRDRNVNPLDYKDVKNYYQSRRNKATQLILQTIKATEQKMNNMPEVKALLKGKQFKVNMLDPHLPGIDTEKAEDQAISSD